MDAVLGREPRGEKGKGRRLHVVRQADEGAAERRCKAQAVSGVVFSRVAAVARRGGINVAYPLAERQSQSAPWFPEPALGARSTRSSPADLYCLGG